MQESCPGIPAALFHGDCVFYLLYGLVFDSCLPPIGFVCCPVTLRDEENFCQGRFALCKDPSCTREQRGIAMALRWHVPLGLAARLQHLYRTMAPAGVIIPAPAGKHAQGVFNARRVWLNGRWSWLRNRVVRLQTVPRPSRVRGHAPGARPRGAFLKQGQLFPAQTERSQVGNLRESRTRGSPNMYLVGVLCFPFLQNPLEAGKPRAGVQEVLAGHN